MSVRLITIPFSHFCEKARWALDRAGVPYREEGHAPLFHAPSVWRATKGRSRTTPVLIDGGQVFADSTQILQHLAANHGASWLYPTPEALELEEKFDRYLGPATRVLGYFYLLPDREKVLDMFGRYTPRWQSKVLAVAYKPVRKLMERGLGISERRAQRSREIITQTFEEVSERLRDGRPYLCGDTFSAADLTFAALSSPALFPPEHPRFVSLLDAPQNYQTEVQQFLESPAAKFALNLYANNRSSMD